MTEAEQGGVLQSAKIVNAAMFAACMVVGIHTAGRPLSAIPPWSSVWLITTLGSCALFQIAVPFFFICSGYFLAGHMEEHGWWRRECVKRVRTLLVPYVIWSLACAFLPFTIVFLTNLAHGRLLLMPMNLGIRFWIDTLGLHPCRFPRCVPLWYLRALIMFVIASPLLRYCLNVHGGSILLLCYLASLAHGALMLFIPNHPLCLFFQKCFNLTGLFYFCCGVYGRMYNLQVPHNGNGIALLIGTAIVVSSTFAERWSGMDLLPVTRVMFVPPLLFGLWKFIPEHPLPKWLTGTTFAVYVMHPLVFQTMGQLFHFKVETIPQWIANWTIGFFGATVIALAMRKCCPRVAWIVFGGR